MKSALTYSCSSDYHQHRANMFALRQRVNGSVPERFFDSFYQGNPAGEPLLGLCFDGEKLVGQENYIRQDFSRAGKIYRGGMGINTLIDPDYRLFHGVFGKLCTLTMDDLRSRVDLLFAYANEESKKYYLKYFDWQITCKVGVYKKITATGGPLRENLLSFLRPGAKSRNLQLQETSRFEAEKLDPLLESHRQNVSHAYFHKTADFLNWKFLANTHYSAKGYYLLKCGELAGYCVTYDDGSEKKVLDFIVAGNDRSVCASMLSSLAQLSREHGLRRLVLYATPGCWYEGVLRSQVFLKRWEIDFLTHAFDRQAVEGQWVIQIGDFDMY